MKVLKFGSPLTSAPENLSVVVDRLSAEDGSFVAIIRGLDPKLISEELGKLGIQIEEAGSLNVPESFSSPKTVVFLAENLLDEAASQASRQYNKFVAELAVQCRAEELVLLTDTDGILTADPHLVEDAFPIERLSYAESLELGDTIFPSSLGPALEAKIKIRVKNFFNPEHPGTVVEETAPETDKIITGISLLEDISLLRVEGTGLVGVTGMAGRVFSSLSEASINIKLISQASSELSICFAVSEENGARAAEILSKEFASELSSKSVSNIDVSSGNSIISIVGENMRNSPGMSARFFEPLGRNGINVLAIAQGSSELNVSAVIKASDSRKALNSLHQSFFKSRLKHLNLFCVGTGQVGAKLFEQLAENRSNLSQDQDIALRLVGLSNSRKMLISKDGLDLSDWEALLDNSGEPASLDEFVAKMKELNLANSVFIDTTASEEVSDCYKDILASSISIVTPNKKANSGPYSQFLELERTADKANVKFFYETNVGAGLPVIETLKNLIRSGDEVTKIEAVLSGTLSYIFNSFGAGDNFSDIVIGAKESGYTEPDPRDDLSGMDVARKLLILAREAGLPLEENDLSIESLIPACTEKASSVEEFLSLLPEADADFAKQRDEALEQNKKLVYIAKLENGKTSVKLDSVGIEHPFYTLSGTDNIVSFTSKRYSNTPLVVKGPGAGTDVTAAGVFADIIRVASYL